MSRSDDPIEVMLGGKKRTIRTARDLAEVIKGLNAEIERLQKLSVDEAIIKNPKSLRDVNKQLALLGRAVSDLASRANEAGESGIFAEDKRIARQLQSLQSSLRDINRSLVDMAAESGNASRGIVGAYENMQQSLEALRDEYGRLLQAQLNASSADEWVRLDREIRNVVSDIEDMQAKMTDVSSAVTFMTRTGGELFLTAESSIEDFIAAAEKMAEINPQIHQTASLVSELSENVSGVVDKYRDYIALGVNEYHSEIVSSVLELQEENKKLQQIVETTNDPYLYDLAIQKMERINQLIAERSEGLARASTPESFISAILTSTETIESTSAATEAAIKQEQTLYEYILRLQEAQTDLAKIRKETYDPATIELIAAKERQITEEIQRRNEQLVAMRNVRAQGFGNRMIDQRQAEFSNQAFTNIAVAVNTASPLLEGLGAAIIKATSPISATAKDMDKISEHVSLAVSNIAIALEQAALSVERAASVQQGLFNIGNSISDFGTMLAAKGGSGGLGGALGMFGGKVQALGGMITKFAPVVGQAQLAIEGINLGFQVFDALAGRSAEQIQKRIEKIKEEIASTRRINALVASGDRSAIYDSIRDTIQQISELEQTNRELAISAVDTTSTFDQMRTVLGHIVGDNTIYGETGDRLRENQKELDKLNEELERLREAASYATVELNKVRNELADEVEGLADDIKAREEELADARINILIKQKAYQDDLAAAELEYLESTKAAATARADEDREALRSHLEELSRMEVEYGEKIEDMRLEHYKSLLDVEAQYRDDLSRIIATYEDDMADIISEYNKAEADAEKQLREDLQREQTDYQKSIRELEIEFAEERIRRQRDLQEQLFEAEMDNDALRYFMLLRQGEEEEKEAEKQHRERLSDEKEAHRERLKDIQEQYKLDKEARLQDYMERRKERHEQYVEELAARRRQFDNEIKTIKEEFAQRIKEEKELYQEQRANAVEAFREEQRQRELARTQEDADRIERLAARRAELDEAWQLEMEYFSNREAALQNAILGLQQFNAEAENLQRIVMTGQGELTETQIVELLSGINRDLMRLREYAPQGDPSQLPETERLRYEALSVAAQNLNDLLQTARTTGAAVYDEQAIFSGQSPMGRGVNFTTFLAGGIDASGVLSDALLSYIGEEVRIFNEGMSVDLSYVSDAEREIARTVRSMSTTGELMYSQLAEAHSNTLAEMQLQQTEWGLASLNEIKEHQQAQNEILESKGTESLDELRSTAERMGDDIVANFQATVAEREAAQEEELNVLQSYFAARERGEIGFSDDMVAAQEAANRERLEKEDYYLDTEAQVRGGFYETASQQTSQFAENELSARAGLGKESLALQAELGAAELANDSAIAENKILLAQQTAENEIALEEQLSNERLKNIQRANEMMQRGIDGGMKSIMAQIRNAVLVYGNDIVNAYNVINMAIARNAKALSGQMSSYSSSSGGKYAASSPSSRKYGGSSSGKRGLFAAKGAVIEDPTFLVAGEGGRRELVVPFDESSGIPPDILREFANELFGGLGLSHDSPALSVGGSQVVGLLTEIAKGISQLEMGMSLTIDSVNVGSDITRSEIKSQFMAMQQAIVEAVMNASFNRRG
ncbi:MAG: hypothetical protein D6712_10585 [Chloroflexi bacterium]|nr:MAG: hypothetical protein D6712_10585 [Chloroflexota bacterium]